VSATPTSSPSPAPPPPALPPPFSAVPPYNFGDPTGLSPTLPVADTPATVPACVLLNGTSNVLPEPLPTKSTGRAYVAAAVGLAIVGVLVCALICIIRYPRGCVGRWCQLCANCCPPLDCLPPLGGLELYLAIVAKKEEAAKKKHKKPLDASEVHKEATIEAKTELVGVDKWERSPTPCEQRCIDCSPELDESLGNSMPSAKGLACTAILVAILFMYSVYALLLWRDSNLVIVDALVPFMTGLSFLNPPQPLMSSIVGGVPGVSGIALRFFVDGDPAKCSSPLSAVSSDDMGRQVAVAPPGAPPATVLGLAASGRKWIRAQPQRCGGSARQLNQVTFYCPRCTFLPTSALTLTFDFSCQSILMEAVAVQAYPGNTLSFSRHVASAQGTNATPLPLGTVEWALPVIPTNVVDLFSDDPTKLWPIPLFTGPGNWSGFLFSASNGVSIVPQPTGVSPSPVTLVVRLPLANYIYLNTLTQEVELWEQLGTIVAFFPSLFGMVITGLMVLRMVFVFSKVCCKAASKKGAKKTGVGGGRTNNPMGGSSTGRGKGAPADSDSS
jgi:hypothetical protein